MATNALTAKQHKAIAALLTEPTIKAAAEAVGVGERTIHTWLKEAAFEASYRDARREAVRQAIAQMQRASSAMVAVLVRLAVKETTPPAARVAAASKVIDTAIKAVELEDLAARLAALEERFGQKL